MSPQVTPSGSSGKSNKKLFTTQTQSCPERSLARNRTYPMPDSPAAYSLRARCAGSLKGLSWTTRTSLGFTQSPTSSDHRGVSRQYARGRTSPVFSTSEHGRTTSWVLWKEGSMAKMALVTSMDAILVGWGRIVPSPFAQSDILAEVPVMRMPIRRCGPRRAASLCSWRFPRSPWLCGRKHRRIGGRAAMPR